MRATALPSRRWRRHRPLLLEKVRRNGIALLAIRDSHHFAALWPDVEPFADEGLVALSVVNSMACVVPHGGQKALFGTNPLAFAAPRAGGDPLVFDMATSAIAHGDVQIAAREGRLLPPSMASMPTASQRRIRRRSCRVGRCCRLAATRDRHCR